jgi:hypothetical protein
MKVEQTPKDGIHQAKGKIHQTNALRQAKWVEQTPKDRFRQAKGKIHQTNALCQCRAEVEQTPKDRIHHAKSTIRQANTLHQSRTASRLSAHRSSSSRRILTRRKDFSFAKIGMPLFLQHPVSRAVLPHPVARLNKGQSAREPKRPPRKSQFFPPFWRRSSCWQRLQGE